MMKNNKTQQIEKLGAVSFWHFHVIQLFIQSLFILKCALSHLYNDSQKERKSKRREINQL